MSSPIKMHLFLIPSFKTGQSRLSLEKLNSRLVLFSFLIPFKTGDWYKGVQTWHINCLGGFVWTASDLCSFWWRLPVSKVDEILTCGENRLGVRSSFSFWLAAEHGLSSFLSHPETDFLCSYGRSLKLSSLSSEGWSSLPGIVVKIKENSST